MNGQTQPRHRSPPASNRPAASPTGLASLDRLWKGRILGAVALGLVAFVVAKW
jgi:hypothetical protein